jgi:hypothetical protein
MADNIVEIADINGPMGPPGRPGAKGDPGPASAPGATTDAAVATNLGIDSTQTARATDKRILDRAAACGRPCGVVGAD